MIILHDNKLHRFPPVSGRSYKWLVRILAGISPRKSVRKIYPTLKFCWMQAFVNSTYCGSFLDCSRIFSLVVLVIYCPLGLLFILTIQGVVLTSMYLEVFLPVLFFQFFIEVILVIIRLLETTIYLKQEPIDHMALVTRSEPRIRLGTRVIDFIVLARPEAPNSLKR